MRKNKKRIDPRYFLSETTYRDEDIIEEELGNIALDLIGLIPIGGEAADMLNAFLLIRKGKYLQAAFSIISMFPEIGDIIGKGGKITTWMTQNFPKTAGAISNLSPSIIRLAEMIQTHEQKIKALFMKLKQDQRIKEYMSPEAIDMAWDALTKFVTTIAQGASEQETGTVDVEEV